MMSKPGSQSWSAALFSLVIGAAVPASPARADVPAPTPPPAASAAPANGATTATSPAHPPPIGSAGTNKVGQSEIVSVVYGEGLAVEQGQFTLSFADGGTPKISLLVFNTANVPLTKLTAATLLVKKPGAASAPPGAAADILRPDAIDGGEDVPAAGKAVSFTPVLSAFTEPGTYTAVVRVQATEGPDKPVRSAIATLTLVSPPAELNDAELNNATIEVTRHWPLEEWSCSRTVRLTLSETGGRRDLERGVVAGGMVYRAATADQTGGTKPLCPGRFEVKPDALAKIAAGSSVDLLVTPRDFDSTGVFSTKLVVTSASLNGGRVSIPLQVRVSDGLFWPLAVIALGVFGGFFVNNLLQQQRPRDLNRYTMAGYSADLRELERTAEDDNRAKITDLKGRLADAAFHNSLGDFDTVKTALASIETDLNKFKADKAQQKTTARADLDALRRHIASYKDQTGLLADADAPALDAAAGKLADAGKLLDNGEVDAAVKKIAEARPGVSAVFRKSLKNWANRLTTAAAGLSTPGTLPARLAAVTGNLDKGDLSDADLDTARNQLETIAAEMRNARTATGDVQFAREGDTFDTESMPPGVPARAHRPRIVIAGPPESWVVNTPLAFQLEPPPDGQKTVEWIIREQPEPLPGPTLEQVFTDAGEHVVSARIKEDGKVAAQISKTFYVQPGQRERAREQVLRSLKFGDYVLAGVSLALATLTGLIYLYSGKTFGTLGDYVLALLWGFGLDSTVRGYSNVLLKLRAGGAAGGS